MTPKRSSITVYADEPCAEVTEREPPSAVHVDVVLASPHEMATVHHNGRVMSLPIVFIPDRGAIGCEPAYG
jgi:hypothetical protein